MKKSLLSLILFFVAGTLYSQPVTKWYTAPSSVTIDGTGAYGYTTLPGVSFSHADFANGCIVSDVNVAINWAKTAGTCTSPTGGNSFHSETSFRINGPSNNEILAVPGTWSGHVSTYSVTTTFNQGSAIPSGTPVTGTFGPNNGNLNDFNGSSAIGTWKLYPGDQAFGDPLCLNWYNVQITTAADNTAPVISGPSNITVNATSGQCGANVSYTVPTATDACTATVSRTGGPASGSFFSVGTVNVQHVAADPYGNTSIHNFTVTVVDNQPPTISCPANITVNTNSGSCVATGVSLGTPSTNDNCGVASVTNNAPLTYPLGVTNVTWTVTDNAGLTATCVQTVTVVDNQNPTITCPSNVTVNANPGSCFASGVVLGSASANDNCSIASVTNNAPINFPVGNTTVTWTATDGSGRTATCNQTVTVIDNQPPSIVCPTAVTVNANPGSCVATGVSLGTPAGADNCTSPTFTNNNPGTYVLGPNTVTWTATDAAGNTATCQQIVTVVDNQNPTITCPPPVTVYVNPNSCVATGVVLGTPTVGDNCSVASISNNAPLTFALGNTTVVWTVTDGAGRTATCNQTVTVIDNINPTIICPANVTVNVDPGTCVATGVSLGAPSTSDNCSVSTTTNNGLLTYPLGATTVVWTVTDGSGNTATCNQTVTVVDNQNPTITCPAAVTVNADPGFCSASGVALGTPTTGDNCSVATTTNNALAAFPVGNTTVVWTVTDGSGNTATCNQSVTVIDNQNPTIACPSDITVNAAAGQCQRAVTFSPPTYSDNCPGSVLTQTGGLPSGSIFSVGMHTISYLVTDASGNTATCSFTITVVDNQVPIFSNCPIDFSQNTTPGQCSAVVNYPTLLANDNCDGPVTPVMTTSGTASGSTFPIGATVVTYTATDAAGNIGTCSFTVTVVDNEAPQMNCPSDQTVTFDANCQYTILNYVAQVGYLQDNCTASPTVTQSPPAGTVITGSTPIVMTATDAAGNSTSCTFHINPNDVIAPTFVACLGDQQVNVNSICQFTLPDYTNTAVNDDCDPSPVVTQSPAAGAILTSTTPVTLTVTDASGNSTQCSFNVSPNDATPPTLTCPGNQSEPFNSNCQFVVPDYTGLATATDNCAAPVTKTQSPAPGTVITGSQLITITATDGNSNSSSCTFSVIPIDNTPPVISCANDQTVSYNAQCTFTIPNYTGLATASDNCGGTPVITQSPVSGTSIGTTTSVTLTATDASGNTSSCSFNVILQDNTAPTMTCPGDQNVSFNASCGYTLLNYTGLAGVTDNCSTPVVTQSPAAGTVITTTTTVTITATDGAGNVNSCTFDVIPSDNTNPFITCPGNQTEAFNANCQFVLPDYSSLAVTSDNCGTQGVSQSPAPGTVISGLTTVTLTATDGSGNIGTCTFNVIPADNINPTIACPGDQLVSFNSSCQYSLIDYTSMATTSDNCDQSVTVTQSPSFGTVITATQTVTLTATDDAGNTATCTFHVIPSDNTNPVITCPGNQSENFSAGCDFVLPDYTGLATSSDNCDASPTITQSPAAGTTIIGSTLITLTATDAAGNSSSCTFSVLPLDNTPPVITCSGDQFVSFNSLCSFNIPNYTGLATVTDNCDPNPVITQSPVSGTSIGVTTTVTLTATDASGNSSSCTFDVVPADNTIPNISCPGDQNVSFNASCGYTLLNYTGMATANDNCGVPVVTQSPAAGTVITTSTVVTLTATDGSGNINTCTFNVIPTDNTNPVISCPGNQTVSFDANCQHTLSSYVGLATATDNCDPSPVITQSPAAGTVITGLTVVTLTATDATGNIASCSFNVAPNDNIAPVITCLPNQEVSSNASCDFMIIDYTATATVTDNCDQSVTVTQTPAFGTIITVATTVTLTATDDNGNTASCSFLVTPADSDDPSISCPGDQQEDFDANCLFTLPDYTTLATATDNCSASPTVTQSPAAGTVISGSTLITLTATDTDLNTATCTFNVIPSDNTAPVVSCGGDLTVSYTGQCQFIMPDYTGTATASDNCPGAITITQSPTVGTLIGGVTVVTIFATDVAGNIGSCTFTVTPEDDSDPVLSCPGDRIESFNSNCQFTLPNYTSLISVYDNCSVPPFTIVQSPAAGTVISGTTTVMFTVTDGAGNQGSCSFDVIPNDVIAPSIACPGTQQVTFNSSCQFVLADYTGSATVSDNCDLNPTVTQSPAAGSTLNASTLVTLTATDGAGNSSSCSFNVVPSDVTPPSVTCSGDQNVVFNSNCEFTIPDYSFLATVSDNCDNTPFITQSPTIGSVISGQTTVTITAVDDAGNTNSCSFEVIPTDNINPTITCPSNQLVSLDADCEYDLLDYTSLAIASDNCDNSLVITQLPAQGTTITTQTTVTLTATDDAGNTASCSFQVIPSDDTAPTVTCPGDMAVSYTGQCQFIIPDYTGLAVVDDNCSTVFTVTQIPIVGTVVSGPTVVTLYAADANGNVGSCTFTITPSDNTDPVVTCPGDQVESFDANCQFTLPSYTALASVYDNCTVPPFAVSQSPVAGTVITGPTTITLSVTDLAGNTGSCTFDVLPNDVVPPSITCPGNQLVDFNSNCQYGLLDYTGLTTVSDNCDPSPTVVQSPAVGTLITAATTVTITATDAAGNTSACNFSVIPEDNTDPTVVCPADFSVNFNANCQFTIPDYTGIATISDNCDNAPYITQSPSIGTIVTGLTTVTITALDDAGNSESCSFDITPVDVTLPIITCPSNQLVSLGANCNYVLADYTGLAMASDACDQSLQITQSPAAGTIITASTVVTLTATDDAGNVASCTFSVIPSDNTAPVVTCPGNQTVNLSPSCQYIVQDYTGLATVTDNCSSNFTVTQSPLAGSVIGGATVITISATDASGNVGTCTFTVTPLDVTPPTIFGCPADITVNVAPNTCGAVVTYGAITAIDNCAGVVVPQLVTPGFASGSTFPLGASTVTYVADDGNGNTSTCSFVVTVIDNQDPVIVCPASINVNVEPGTCGAAVTYSLPTVSDNCTNGIIPTLEAGLPSGSTFPVGINTVTFEAEDASGNTSTCSFTVTVHDNEAPVISCPSNITANVDPGTCGAAVAYPLPTVTDNCTSGIVPVLTAGSASGSVFPLGTTTITYMATDASGNTHSCSFTITVVDNETPVITCPASFSVNVDPSTCSAVVTYPLPTVSDNCTSGIVPSLVSGPASGGTFPLGPTVVTYMADDGNGNTETCSFTVTVVDNEQPSITCSGDQYATFSANCSLVLPNYTGLALAFDNCDGNPTISQSPAPGTTVVGVTTVTLTATDFAGNSNSCSFQVIDNTPPVISCLGNQTVGSNINCQYVLPNYIPLITATDNCGAVAVSQDPPAGTVISSTTTITMTGVDDFGNIDSCSFNVSLIDNIDPNLTCLGNQTVFLNQACQYQLPNYASQAFSSDNCDPDPLIEQLPAPGTFIDQTTPITLTATDASGNSVSCTFNVIPQDITSPTVNCPGLQTVEMNGDCEFILQDYTSLAVTGDNCGPLTVTQSPPAGTILSNGVLVTLTVVDGAGNQGVCSFGVVPEDNEAPAITCPGDLVVDYDQNCEFVIPNYTSLAVTVTDNCSNAFQLSQNPAVGTVVSGPTEIWLIADDLAGNLDSCSFNITPVDNTPPDVICVGDQMVSVDANCEFEIGDYAGLVVPTATDNCSGVITVTQIPVAGTSASATTSVTLTASDGNGNTVNCVFDVIPTDDDPPVITCPGVQNVSFDSDCEYILLDYSSLATVTDNCTNAGDIVITQALSTDTTGAGGQPGDAISTQVTIVLTATDQSGNVATCSFDVIPVDDTPPFVNCPGDQDVFLNGNCEYEIPSYQSLVTGGDNCGVVAGSQDPLPGTIISTSTEVFITVEDAAGNTSSCSFMVHPSDNTSPTIVCPGNQLVNLDANCEFVLPDYIPLTTISDNCTSSNNASMSPPAGTVITGSTVVTITAEDDNGNTSSCSFAVVPEDNEAPEITVCPADQTLEVSNLCAATIPDFTGQVTAVDNCDTDVEVSQIPLAGTNLSGLNPQTVTISAVDDLGNSTSCTFVLTPVDISAPILTCPSNQQLSINANCEFVLPDYTALATVSDGCNTGVTLSQSPPPGSVITGQLNATIIAEDGSGNISSCTFFVNPVGMQVSVNSTNASCNGGSDGSATAVASGGTGPYTYNWLGENPAQLSAGTYNVVATDANGCQATGSVTVGDGEVFEIEITTNNSFDLCPGESTVLNAGAGYASYDWSTGATVQNITVFNQGSYWVQVANALGCWSEPDTVSVTVYSVVVPQIIETPDGLLNCSNETAVSYQWYLNGDIIPNATNPWYCPIESGNYVVRIVDENGCEVDSYTDEYTFSDSSPCAIGIDEQDLSMDIYPNPSTGEFIIRYELDKETELSLTVFDVLGNQVTQSVYISTMSGTQVIDLSKEADGVYMLRVEMDKSRVFQQRLMLVK